jgi:hypothetical protein
VIADVQVAERLWATVFRDGTVVALTCLVLPGCASAQRTGEAHIPAGTAD